jgi:hypothetical protein
MLASVCLTTRFARREEAMYLPAKRIDWQSCPVRQVGSLWPKLLSVFLLAGLMVPGAGAQEISASAVAEATAGSQFEVSYSGSTNQRDFITIVAAGSAAGKYNDYQYARQSPVKLQAPSTAGSYEIRYLAADSPYPTLWSQPLTVTEPTASLQAPQSVAGGKVFEVTWTGPDNPQDFITIVAAGAAEGHYESGYQYTGKGSPVRLTAPDAPGSYEIRYLMGQAPHRSLARQQIEVQGTEAGIQAPTEVPAGAPIRFTWQGPGNVQDFITVVPAGAPDKDYGRYVYTRQGPSLELPSPEEPGDYELRYLTGQSNTVLARTAFKTTPVHAKVHGPEFVEALSTVLVTWKGPGNPQDYVIIQPVGSKVSDIGPYAYTHRGPELRITAPADPGRYEYRYVTGQSNRLLATQAVNVTPRNLPGKLRVSDGRSGQAVASSNVIVILDASGSMLQRLEGERRIDIAKASLQQLVSKDLPDNIQFGFRVFGHKEADSCRTDLEIPLAQLNRQAAEAKVAGISAMNLAKTPIAATLQQAGGDLAGKSGPSLIILLTDGEETCEGDPAAVISSLRAGGLDVRVNIVGFAIDELMLRESFASWAALGGGQYIDARNAAELSAALSSAIERPFEVFGADGNKAAAGLVNGMAVELPPGEYRLQITGTEAQTVTVAADEEVLISLD